MKSIDQLQGLDPFVTQAAGDGPPLLYPLQRLRFHLQTAFSTRRQQHSAYRFSQVEGQNTYAATSRASGGADRRCRAFCKTGRKHDQQLQRY